MLEGSCRIPDTALPSYAVYPGLRLYADPSVRLGVRLNGTFGSVDGDDAHCRRVCDAVPGCNSVTRSSGKPCLLHDVCIRPPANGPLPEFPAPGVATQCEAGAITMLTRKECRARPTWYKLTYRLPIEGDMLGTIAVESPERCREVCDKVPGCNSFAHQVMDLDLEARTPGFSARCYLKGRCAQPTSPETRLDVDPTKAGQLSRLRGRFVSHYKWPCTDESVLYPLPGLRRSLPPDEPSGLVSLDCKPGAPSAAKGGFITTGNALPAERVRGFCDSYRVPQPTVTEIRYPSFYQPPPQEVIKMGQRAAWQGRDVYAPLSPAELQQLEGLRPGGPPAALREEERSIRRLFELVAAEVAAKSFNGKEVILLTSNTEGLPLSINLIANLAQFGHHHTLMLASHADGAEVCGHLIAAAPPPCVWSSLLTEYRNGLKGYVNTPVWALWLQRYCYMQRLVLSGYNTLLLDTDVILFHDPYPFFKGLLANYSAFVLGDSSAGFAAVNGGIYYLQNAHVNGPVVHIFSEFERRIRATLGAVDDTTLKEGRPAGRCRITWPLSAKPIKSDAALLTEKAEKRARRGATGLATSGETPGRRLSDGEARRAKLALRNSARGAAGGGRGGGGGRRSYHATAAATGPVDHGGTPPNRQPLAGAAASRRSYRWAAVGQERLICYDRRSGHKQGWPADVLLYDQSVINNVLLSELVGHEAHMLTSTHLDLDPQESNKYQFWEVPELEWATPRGLGTYGQSYPSRYARRERTLVRTTGDERVAETIMMAPPWLFSAESDSRVPPVSADAAGALPPNFAPGHLAPGTSHLAPVRPRRSTGPVPTETRPVPLPRGIARSQGIYPGRPAARVWAQNPPPSTLVHFVCAAWPGSGGRIMAMELWGKWFYGDVDAHLGTTTRRLPSKSPSNSEPPRASPMGFEAHSWLRVCGVACVVGRCNNLGSKRSKLPLCFNWMSHHGDWNAHPLRGLASLPVLGQSESAQRPGVVPSAGRAAAPSLHRALKKLKRRAGSERERATEEDGRRAEEMGSSAEALRYSDARAVLTPIEQRAAAIVAFELKSPIPADLAAAADAAATLHPHGLVAFSRPLAAADRREYQVYAHILMSAAMLTRRKPVLPLAVCAPSGEWSASSRCIYVLHAATPPGAEYCVQRPPSICHGKVALPNELEGVPDAEVGTVILPRLSLRNGSVDVGALGAALGTRARDRRVLLLDTSALVTADDLSNLLVTPKGWLCTLDHKSCQHAC